MDEKSELIAALLAGEPTREAAFRQFEVMLATGERTQIELVMACLFEDVEVQNEIERQLRRLEINRQNQRLRQGLQRTLQRETEAGEQFLWQQTEVFFRKSWVRLRTLSLQNEYDPARMPLPKMLVFEAVGEFFTSIYFTPIFETEFRVPLRRRFYEQTGRAWKEILTPKNRTPRTVPDPHRAQANDGLFKNQTEIAEDAATDALAKLRFEIAAGGYQPDQSGMGTRWFLFAKSQLFVLIRAYLREFLRRLNF